MTLRPLLVLLLAAASCVAPSPELRAKPYGGWDEALLLSAPAAGVEVTILPAIGGRILRYALGGENVIFENPAYAGKTLSIGDPGSLAQGYTGYQIDIGPELRGIPRHLALWTGPHRWEGDASVVRTWSPPDLTVGLTLDKSFAIDGRSGALRIEQRMKNVLPRAQSYCLWDRTLCRAGGFVILPLREKSRFRVGWSLMQQGGYDGEAPVLAQARVMDGVLIVHAESEKPHKLGADSDAGWIAYALGRRLFVKYFPWFPEGKYSDGGNSVEVYFDPRVAELEPLSPEVVLQPGESYLFPETWTLRALDREVTTFEEARDLARSIPTAPRR